MRIHYLQHVSFETPGAVLNWAKKNGCAVSGTHFYLGQKLPAEMDFDWLIVLGGPMNIYEERRYPWLAEEKTFIRAAISAGKVVLGMCLGAQLIADVLGGKVTQNPYAEIGWFPIRFSKKVKSSELFSFFPAEPVVFEWHMDTFSELPAGAELIAENDACPHQAFIWEERVFGFQFHLEYTEKIVEELVKNCAGDLVRSKYVQTAEQILNSGELIRQGNGWMERFLTRLAAQKEKNDET